MDSGVSNELPRRLSECKGPLLEKLSEFIAIPSVEGTPEPGAPFGREVAKSLDYLLSLAKELGFTVSNQEGYVGFIDWGEGDETIGILSHVDVVPAGDLDAWNTAPFEMTQKDGVVYGRGAADDKGPLLSCLYGAYALKQMGFVPKKKLRFIIGTNEETGWGCMDYYKAHFPPPDASFSPDGMFTVVNREKGILTAEYGISLAAPGVEIQAGEASNLVPAKAVASLPCTLKQLHNAVDQCAKLPGVSFTTGLETNGAYLLCKGRNAPSHSPANGASAILGMLRVLAVCGGIPSELQSTAGDLVQLMGEQPDGKSMGIACSDEVSGALTTNLGILELKENHLTVKMDVRAPVTFALEGIAGVLDGKMAGLGFQKASDHLKPPLYVPADSALIKTLCGVYERVTGQEAVLYSIGGGTYARAFSNCVCFGAVYPGVNPPVHCPNEYATVDDLIKNAKVYGLAIYELLN